VRMPRLAVFVFTTQGTASSRATMAAWDSAPPMSTTRAAEMNMIDDQLGSVAGVTRISPGSTSLQAGSVTTRASPSTTPGLTPTPWMVAPLMGADGDPSSPEAGTGMGRPATGWAPRA